MTPFYRGPKKLHRLMTSSEEEAVWANGFAMIARDSIPPVITIRMIRRVGSGAATIHTCAYFRDGIKLTDGARISPLWQLNSYVLVKLNRKWEIAQTSIHDQSPPGGCAASR